MLCQIRSTCTEKNKTINFLENEFSKIQLEMNVIFPMKIYNMCCIQSSTVILLKHLLVHVNTGTH